MSLTPRLTLIGLYKFNSQLFSNLYLPNTVDEETFIDSLLMEYGECPLIYPDYDYMVLAIGAWCRKWYANIERIADAIAQSYNPLHNYDKTETWTDNESGNRNFNRGTTGNFESNETENGTTEDLVSAYDEDDYQPSNKTIYEKTNGLESEKSEDETYRETNGKQNTRTGRVYGNIGVTESTTMLQHEIDLRRNENLYHIISELFYKEFCLYVF